MSDQRLIIQGGRVIDPAANFDAIADVYIADGTIVAVGHRPDGFLVEKVVDASGKIVCPGFVDLCARLRNPSRIAEEIKSAASAGITDLFCPPDMDPIIDTSAVVNLIREKAEEAGYCRVHPIGALTRGLNGKDLSEMRALKEAGCLAVSNGEAPMANTLVMRRALEYAADCGLVVIIRPNDPWLSAGGCAHEGAVATRLGLPGIPASAETVAIAQTLALVEEVRGRVHFGQLSTARSVELIAEAQARGLSVTADVGIHHLHYTEESLDGFNAQAHVIPPYRTEADRDALRAGVKTGVISAICSDHQPHGLDAKLDSFQSIAPGLPALELLLPLTFGLVDIGVLDLQTALGCLSHGPIQVLAKAGGALTSGSHADLCLFDPSVGFHAQTFVLSG
ncbi:amidohydrolase family protein [Methylococcus sp. EFPC2]|uniref:amidohydrolase family protein n=1 Tax=Methylococcus sp. EFPC2 TaxID=2812648 RepID=UPI001F08546C|nr:amidohydrolase family protein [Methylococcus sp. EFPC2]